MNAEKLFAKYMRELEKQCEDQNRITKFERGLRWSIWNFYFFTKMAQGKYVVWCNKMTAFGDEFGDKLVSLEFLWDLGWFQREDVFGKTGVECCALALEQELSSVWMERWFDFDKILFADVTHFRVFIGRASNKAFETMPKEFATYYEHSKCRKGKRQLLLMLFNKSSGKLRIGGWILKNGSATLLKDKTFFYAGAI